MLREDDSFEEHIHDTLVAGAELCDEPIVRRLVEDGPKRVRELIEWGMPFDRVREGETRRNRANWRSAGKGGTVSFASCTPTATPPAGHWRRHWNTKCAATSASASSMNASSSI